ncbi:MAG TPA: glycolate oxidase subunit GlcE [Rhodospirillales bacterium]|jgi:glycolate oxidase FAD binding subunit|nr:glycolate oxidase subunit GlcE [Rhodospirillales bacterium]
MSETLGPDCAEQVVEAVQWALSGKTSLKVLGAGSKRSYGRPCRASRVLDLSALSGIGLYEPEELVMGAAAATPLVEIEAALAEHRQQLAFEPMNMNALYGGGGGTIGGAVACNLSGPRRPHAGAARDHLLGFHAVSGRGEAFKSGGRVVKNVTGFDLSKLITGSFGTLGVLTEVTFKVLPAPQKLRTVLVIGAADGAAIGAMNKALQAACQISGAAHLPAAVAVDCGVDCVSRAGRAVTAIRVEGQGPSVDERCRALLGLLAEFGATEQLSSGDSMALWRQVRDAAFFKSDGQSQVWRLSVPPAAGAETAAAILDTIDGRVFYDWGGGLLWLAMAPRPDAGYETVRRALKAGGDATLVRAAAEVRASVAVLQPQPAPLAALTARIKDAFDPKGVLNPGRMYEDH